MKSDLIGVPEKSEQQEYPFLGILRDPDFPYAYKFGLVVLFDEEGCGTILHVACTEAEKPDGSTAVLNSTVGSYSSDWAMDAFQPLRGTLELSNG